MKTTGGPVRELVISLRTVLPGELVERAGDDLVKRSIRGVPAPV